MKTTPNSLKAASRNEGGRKPKINLAANTESLRQRNNSLRSVHRKSNTPFDVDTNNAKLAKLQRTRDVPMIPFLASEAIRNFVSVMGKPLEDIDFTDDFNEKAIPVFSGYYYTTLAQLATRICNFAYKDLGVSLSSDARLVSFLQLIHDGAPRQEAAERMHPMRAGHPSSTEPFWD